jgi:sugar phosphate isomerase/epimerase
MRFAGRHGRYDRHALQAGTWGEEAALRFAICNELFEGWEWERVCDFARELGYEGLEVAPFTLADSAAQVSPRRRSDLRRSAETRGVEVLGLHWLLVKPPGLYITHPDPAVRRRTSDYFRELVDLCADLGGKVMVVGSPKQRSLLPGVTREQAWDYTKEVFRPVLDPAARRGVTLAFEPLGPGETDFVNTVEEGKQLADEMNHPNFRLNLDVKAMSSEAAPIPDVVRSAKGYVAHVQVNDPNLLGPGMGEVEHEPIVAALREIGYDGWLSVEAFDFKPGAERIAQESVEYLKRVVG